MNTRQAGAVVLLGAALIGVFADRAAAALETQPVWTEIDWPFLRDQWPNGRAFICRAADCGENLSLYLRAKVGFCNCATGVADDDEIDRVGDLVLLDGQKIIPLEGGRPVAVGAMQGRARPFRVESAMQPQKFVVAVALSNKCDAVVATLVAAREIDRDQQRAALEFLSGETARRWIEANTGLQ